VTGSSSTPIALAEATDLVLRYGDVTALDASTFTLPRAGITAIIGPNGSGKSTILHAIAGLLPAASGTLTVLGASPRESRHELSYVLQSMAVPATTPMTVRETVGMGRYPNAGWWRPFSRIDRERIDQAMHRLQIDHLASRHLHELSGGQRQRVYVAQGLVQDHSVLLLDEPLTGLDIVSARTIDTIVHEERDRGTSVVLTTHDLDEARAADHVVIVRGRVVASGPPSEACTRRNIEIGFGLGNLHEWQGFLDDPAHGFRW
jgi:manganese transport system ATP-binding protein